VSNSFCFGNGDSSGFFGTACLRMTPRTLRMTQNVTLSVAKSLEFKRLLGFFALWAQNDDVGDRRPERMRRTSWGDSSVAMLPQNDGLVCVILSAAKYLVLGFFGILRHCVPQNDEKVFYLLQQISFYQAYILKQKYRNSEAERLI